VFRVCAASPAPSYRRRDLPAPLAGERFLRRFSPLGRCRGFRFPQHHAGGKELFVPKRRSEIASDLMTRLPFSEDGGGTLILAYHLPVLRLQDAPIFAAIVKRIGRLRLPCASG
jgi:hypothetical protein